MKVLIVHMRYSPDPTGTAPLVTQLAEDLAARGVDVTVIVSLPHYGRSSIHPDYQDIAGMFHHKLENDVKVIRTQVFVPKAGSLFQRAINYLSYTINSLIAGVLLRNVDLVLAVNPPITTAFSAWLISLRHRAPMLLSIQDIWPDCIIEVGQLSHPWLIRFSYWLEKKQYRLAKQVIVLSNGMKNNLINKNVSSRKLTVIPNWADPDEVSPQVKENDFYFQHHLEGKFVVLFSGNHGYTAALEHVVEAALLLKGNSEIQFLLAGQGSVKTEIMTLAESYQLDNIKFLTTQPKQKWLEMLAASDLGLVTLRKDLGALNVPSKVYTLISAEVPILASVPANSEIADIIEKANCGYVVPAENPQALGEAILRAKDSSELASLGKNGRTYLLQSLTKKAQMDKYIELLSKYANQD